MGILKNKKRRKNKMFKWNYTSKVEKSTGYENELELQKYTHEYYNSLNEKEKGALS